MLGETAWDVVPKGLTCTDQRVVCFKVIPARGNEAFGLRTLELKLLDYDNKKKERKLITSNFGQCRSRLTF